MFGVSLGDIQRNGGRCPVELIGGRELCRNSVQHFRGPGDEFKAALIGDQSFVIESGVLNSHPQFIRTEGAARQDYEESKIKSKSKSRIRKEEGGRWAS